MKKLLSIILILLAVNTTKAQKKQKSISSYDMNIGFDETKKNFKAFFDVTEEIIFEDGSKVIIGQEMMLGPSSSKISNQFETIIMGKYNMAKAMLTGPPILANTGFERNKYIVEEMKVTRSMGKVGVSFYLRDTEATGALNVKYLTASDYSILRGELINPNRPMTRDEAIAKLKEAKNLLDLEILSQEDYDKEKAILTPIILGKN
jgi:hypothetical protein